MAEIPGIPEDVGLTAGAAAVISQNVSAMLDSATTTAALVMAEEIPVLDTGSIAAAAVSNTVAAMLESATATAVAASEAPVQQLLPTASMASVATTTPIVPPLSTPESTTEDPMSSIELSGRRDCGDDGGAENDNNAVLELELKADSPYSPTPPHPRKYGTAVDAADRSRKSRPELAPVVLSDAGRLFYTDASTNDEKGLDEQKDDEQEDNEREETQDTKETEKGKGVRDEHEDEEGGRLELPEDCNSRVVLSSGPEDGAAVWVLGRREGAVVQVRYVRTRMGQGGCNTRSKTIPIFVTTPKITFWAPRVASFTVVFH